MIRTILYFSFFIFLLSCSKDDTSITGTYIVATIEVADCSNPSSNYILDLSDDNCGTVSSGQICHNGTLNISADGTVTGDLTLALTCCFATIFDFVGEGTYELNDNNLTICNDGCKDYDIRGSNLVISFGSSSGCMTTVTLTKT